MMRLAPKFFPNQPDDNHCLQAAVLTVACATGHNLTADEVDNLTHYAPGRFSWAIRGATVLASLVSGARLKTMFDYQRFATEGEGYLRGIWSVEKLKLQRENSSPNFADEQKAVSDFLESGGMFDLVTSFDRKAVVADLRQNLIISLVSAPMLYKQPVMTSHFIVLYGASEAGNWLFLHDPGLPPKPTQRIEVEDFWKSFYTELIAVPHADIPFGKTFNVGDPCYCGSGKKFKDCHRSAHNGAGILR
jgi:SEC-C motif